jgi:pyruvate dehydrogenase E2 component (dihydrolipoamide acetyltransferase)
VIDFTLPELGENITTGDVLRILVQPGDTVAAEQPVLELETDKATIEVPSSVAGLVKEIKVKVGDKVKVGQAILSVQEGAGGGEKSGSDRAASGGSSAAFGSVERPTREASSRPLAAGPPERAAAAVRTQDSGSGADNVVDFGGRAPAPEPVTPQSSAAATPSVRRMARELGVEIDKVVGSGPGGHISIDDVKAHANRLIGTRTAAPGPADDALPDFSRWGGIERQPMRAVRRKTAGHLAVAWATVPHVTQHDLADITALDALRRRHAKQVEAAGGNLTVTAIAVKIVATALRVFPRLNTSVDMAAEEIIYKKYVHIGVAVDTDRGLLVPVLRDADSKNITQISVELAQLSDKARRGKLTLDEMQGGCFSISNLGGIGGTAFTPIVNVPEVAILGISRARVEPVWRPSAPDPSADADDQGGRFMPRLMLPLALSYDHRVVDGADGVRFLRWVVEAFEQPLLLALQG